MKKILFIAGVSCCLVSVWSIANDDYATWAVSTLAAFATGAYMGKTGKEKN